MPNLLSMLRKPIGARGKCWVGPRRLCGALRRDHMCTALTRGLLLFVKVCGCGIIACVLVGPGLPIFWVFFAGAVRWACLCSRA